MLPRNLCHAPRAVLAVLLSLAASPTTIAAPLPSTQPVNLPPHASPSAQLNELEKRWANYYLKFNDPKEIARLNTATDAALKTLLRSGRFSDLTYGPIVTGRDGGPGWGDHLLRTADLFTAWRLPGTRLHRDPALARQAALALDTYVAAPYDKNDPWGFGHPYADLLESNRIGRCCLFARADPDTFSQKDIERWGDRIIRAIFKPSDDPAKQFTEYTAGWEGGANLLWATRGELTTYLTHSDEALRLRAADRYLHHVWSSMSVRSPKGPRGEIHRLTTDGMLGEHDTPCMGSYGEWYLNDVVAYRDLIDGIPRFEMPPELNALWTDVLIDSIAHCYQGAVDPNLANPLIWLNGRRGDNVKLKEWCRAFLGKNHRDADLQKILDWTPGKTPWPFPDQTIKAYYTTDFITKHYPKYAVSLRAVSNRTYGMETFGQKSARHALESVLLPLGTSFIRRDTSNYQTLTDTSKAGIFSALDFARLPGQTTRVVTPAELTAAWNRDSAGYAVRAVSGNTPFSAGAVTAHAGVWGWQQSRLVSIDPTRTPAEQKKVDLSTDGHRATFFLDHGNIQAVVHLAAGFNTVHPTQPTLTNLDQRLSLNTPITFALARQTQTLTPGETFTSPDITWALYDGVGYLPTTHGTKTLQDLTQPGTPPQQIFSFFSNHGHDTPDLSFTWAILPDTTPETLARYADTPPWTVLSNTQSLQALELKTQNFTAAVFHDTSATLTTSTGTTIKVSRPTVLILENNTLYTADPLEDPTPLTVTLNNKSLTITPNTPPNKTTATPIPQP